MKIAQARLLWMKFVLRDSYSNELQDLLRRGNVTLKSPIKSLNPFLNSSGLLRLAGRLRFAPISNDQKHPMILPRHKIIDLIISHAHLRCLHGGLQMTLHTLRQSFWILGARSLLKTMIKNCSC